MRHLRRHRVAGTAAAMVLIALLARAQTTAYPATAQVQRADLAVRLDDYAALPLPNSLTGRLSRVSTMRVEPGDAPQFASRAFVADLRRSLYILDLQTRTFTTYIDFQHVFAKFVNGSSYGAGVASFAFHPEYSQNGKFYTVHTEGPTLTGSTIPSNEFLPGLDLSGGYAPTDAINPPDGSVSKHAVLIEWTDIDLTDTIFEGTAREVLRTGFSNGNHSIADMVFSPAALSSDPDFANLYVALGDGGAGQQEAQDNSIPQRLDALPGKILRITPDIDRRPADVLAANGRYRIPSTGVDPNPFVELDLPGTKTEIFAYGFRNPQRMSWDAVTNTLIVADIGLYSWEELNVVRKGANYGYSEREGPEELFVGGMHDGKTGGQMIPAVPHPAPDTLTVPGLPAPVMPRYPAAAFSHRDGDAIAGGFVYRGTLLPQLYGKYVFGDITTARVFYVDLTELLAADDDDRASLATIHELQILFDHPDDTPDRGAVAVRLFDVIAEQYARRGGDTGDGARLPQAGGHLSDELDTQGVAFGGGRADIRFAEDRQGELYILSKSDGMIRRLSATRSGVTSTDLTSSPNPSEAGGTVQLSALVTAAAGQPVGSIEFFDDSTSLGTASLVAGSATTTVSGLTAGAHRFIARFVPSDQTFLESAGGVVHSAGQPDLVPSVSALPAAAAPATPLSFTEATANTGPASAAASTTRYYLSADAAYGAEIVIGSRTVSTLESGTQSVGSLSLEIPSSTPLGQYYVIACADSTGKIGEGDEANNCSASATTINVTRQDLLVTLISSAAVAVAPGDTFTVADTVHNHGGIASVSSATRFYFSADAVKSADDRLLTGSRAVSALAPGASSSRAGTTLTVPATTTLGLYVLIACADDTAKNVEISETDNCAAAAGPVLVGRPDLVISSLSNPPLEIAPGKTFMATAATTNQGTAGSAASNTRLYLSLDIAKDASDVLFTTAIPVTRLTPGKKTSSSKTLMVPRATADGTYYLLACSDAASTSIELDEMNNCTPAARTVQVKRPDLLQSAVSSPPASVVAGGTFSVTDTAINAGSIASASSVTRYYFSLDTAKTAEAVLLIGGRSLPSLNPGGSNSGAKTVTVPGLPSGTYYLLACADDNAVVLEQHEDNNCRASAVTTIVP